MVLLGKMEIFHEIFMNMLVDRRAMLIMFNNFSTTDNLHLHASSNGKEHTVLLGAAQTLETYSNNHKYTPEHPEKLKKQHDKSAVAE